MDPYQCILVTGGTGSIGSAVVRRLLSQDKVTQIHILSRNDSHQWHLKQELEREFGAHRLRWFLGDVRDPVAVQNALQPDVGEVIHCAAIKHVVGAEVNPREAASVNVDGTSNVLNCLEAARRGLPCRFTLLSTDKAAAPCNVMGATKYLAERVVLHHSGHCRRAIVRFGNVWRSHGSVVPTWTKAIESGAPLLVSDWTCTRFIISIDEAVDALLYARSLADSDPVLFIPNMKALSLYDMLVKLRDELGIKHPLPVKIIGLAHGEKQHEHSVAAYEAPYINAVTMEGVCIGTRKVGTWGNPISSKDDLGPVEFAQGKGVVYTSSARQDHWPFT